MFPKIVFKFIEKHFDGAIREGSYYTFFICVALCAFLEIVVGVYSAIFRITPTLLYGLLSLSLWSLITPLLALILLLSSLASLWVLYKGPVERSTIPPFLDRTLAAIGPFEENKESNNYDYEQFSFPALLILCVASLLEAFAGRDLLGRRIGVVENTIYNVSHYGTGALYTFWKYVALVSWLYSVKKTVRQDMKYAALPLR